MGKPLQLSQPNFQLGILPVTGNIPDAWLLKIFRDKDPQNFPSLQRPGLPPGSPAFFHSLPTPKKIAIPLFQPTGAFKTAMAGGGASAGVKPTNKGGEADSRGFNNSDYLWVAAGLEVLFGTPYLARLFWAKDENLADGYRTATLGLISGGGFFMGAAAGNLVCRATGYLDEHLICQGVGAVMGGLLAFSVASNIISPYQHPALQELPQHGDNHGRGRGTDPMDGIHDSPTYSNSSTSSISTTSTFPTTSYPTSTSMVTTTSTYSTYSTYSTFSTTTGYHSTSSSSRSDSRYPVDSFGP